MVVEFTSVNDGWYTYTIHDGKKQVRMLFNERLSEDDVEEQYLEMKERNYESDTRTETR